MMTTPELSVYSPEWFEPEGWWLKFPKRHAVGSPPTNWKKVPLLRPLPQMLPPELYRNLGLLRKSYSSPCLTLQPTLYFPLPQSGAGKLALLCGMRESKISSTKTVLIIEGEQTWVSILPLAHGLLPSYVTRILSSQAWTRLPHRLSWALAANPTSACVRSIPTFPDEGNKRSCCVRHFW